MVGPAESNSLEIVKGAVMECGLENKLAVLRQNEFSCEGFILVSGVPRAFWTATAVRGSEPQQSLLPGEKRGR